MRRRGFTLIELLVVISIIALLMAILTPALSRVKKEAKDALCRANLHQLGLATSLYAENNNQRIMPGWNYGPDSTNRAKWMWINALRPFFKDERVLSCPMAVRTVGEGGQTANPFTAWGEFDSTWVDADGQSFYADHERGSYGINVWACDRLAFNGQPSGGDGGDCWRILTQKKASRIPLIADCRSFQVPAWANTNKPAYDGAPSAGGDVTPFCLNRHSMAINIVFFDITVRHVGLKQLWGFYWGKGGSNWLSFVDNYQNRLIVLGTSPTYCTRSSTYDGWLCQARNYDL